MTQAAPIPTALTITRRALYAVLSPLVAVFGGLPACYWKQANSPTSVVQALTSMPPTLSGAIVFGPQDKGGVDDGYIGTGGWNGLITIKAHGPSLTAAEALLEQVAGPLVVLTAPFGYTVTAQFVSPLDLPTLDGVYTVASIYRVYIYRV